MIRTGRAITRGDRFRLIGLGLLGLLLAAGLMLIGMTAQRGLPGRSHYELQGEFAELTTLAPYAEVRIAGRRVGQVLSASPRDGHAVVELQLDEDIRPLRADTRLRIRPKGLLGAQYVDVYPGESGAPLTDGDTIPLRQTSASTQLSDVLSALDEPRRKDLKVTIGELGRGMLGRGADVNDLLADVPALLRDTRGLARTVNERRGAARRFYPSVASMAAAQAFAREDIARGFDPQARALRPFDERSDDVEAALEQAPAALSAARAGARDAEPMLAQLTRFAEATTESLRPAPRALDQAAKLLVRGGPGLRAGDEVLQRVAAVTPSVARLDRELRPLLGPTADNLRWSAPQVGELGRYGCDILKWGRNWRSMLGHATPGEGPFGPLNVLRYEGVPSNETIGGSGDDAMGPVFRNPYPKPCEAGEERIP